MHTQFKREGLNSEAFVGQIHELYKLYPDARLVGSLGRAASHRAVHGDVAAEFIARGESLLTSNGAGMPTPRDIDVVLPQLSKVDHIGPFTVDATAYNYEVVKIVQEGDDWVLESPVHRKDYPLHPAVMEPYSGRTILDADCVTLHPQTMRALSFVKGVKRAKDIVSVETLDRAIERFKGPRLPAEMLEPFYDLGRANANSRYVQAQQAYNKIVPDFVRYSLRPFVQTAKRVIF